MITESTQPANTIAELLTRVSDAVREEQASASLSSSRRGILDAIERMLQQPLHAASLLNQPDLR